MSGLILNGQFGRGVQSTDFSRAFVRGEKVQLNSNIPTDFSLSSGFDKLKLVGHQTDPLPKDGTLTPGLKTLIDSTKL